VNDHECALVLSLRPRFADSILDGRKSVELRRQRVSPSPGTAVLLYASAPVMAVVGTARVAEVHIDEPDCVWHQFHLDLGLKREEFEQYVAGATGRRRSASPTSTGCGRPSPSPTSGTRSRSTPRKATATSRATRWSG
jgi:predicted transcriptional regulator